MHSLLMIPVFIWEVLELKDELIQIIITMLKKYKKMIHV